MIKIEKLQKVFRTEEIETYALNGVDIEVKKLNKLLKKLGFKDIEELHVQKQNSTK